MADRQPLATGEALIACYTSREIEGIRTTYPGVDVLHEAGKCVQWHNDKRGGAIRWKQTFTNWLKKESYGEKRQASSLPGGSPTAADPLEKFRHLERDLDAERERRGTANVSRVQRSAVESPR